jgi:hypothetical protein
MSLQETAALTEIAIEPCSRSDPDFIGVEDSECGIVIGGCLCLTVDGKDYTSGVDDTFAFKTIRADPYAGQETMRLL